MLELFRDTVIGHFLRWVSHGRLLPHAEDIDPSLWRMYVSTEKSTKLEHLVTEKEVRKSSRGPKRLKKRNGKPATAASSRTGINKAEENKPASHPGKGTVPDFTEANLREPQSSPATKDEQRKQGVEQPPTKHTGGKITPVGGHVCTDGVWNNAEEAREVWTDMESPQSWSNFNTPNTWSNADTPKNGSSTFLISDRGDTHPAQSRSGELEQGWVTAAMGQEGMDVSVQQGQVDGDPAIQLHSEGDETAWKAIQLEAGQAGAREEPEAAQENTVDSAADRVINVVVWFGPHDPANPLNWSYAKRAFVTAQIYLLTVCTYIGTSIFSPGSASVQEHFGVGEVAATLGTSLAILGYGLGVMIWSPMSEAIRLGRKPVYLVTLTVFVGLQIPTALAKNFGMLLAFRFLSGIFGAPVLAIGGASINDMYPATQRGFAIVLWDSVSIVAPVLGPLIGGFAADANGWRWTIWILLWFSGASLILFIFFMPETNQSNILYRRSRRLRVLTGNKTLRSEQDVLGGQLSVVDTLERLFARPFVLCFTEPILLVINTYIALLNAILFGSLDSFPLVFNSIYGFKLGEVGLAFLGLLAGSILVLPPMFFYLRSSMKPNQAGEVRPEKRLPPAIIGAFLAPISLFIFGWTARASIHWLVPIMGSALFGIAIETIMYAALNYLPDAYPSYTASVLAGNECLRSTASAVFPLFTTAMYKRLGVGWASTLLGSLSLIFIPVPIVLYYYGHVVRKWSKRAKQDF